jgi:hypothetical protein
MTGLKVMAINRMARGLHVPNAVDLARVAEVLETTVDKLLAAPPMAPILAATPHPQENLSATA